MNILNKLTQKWAVTYQTTNQTDYIRIKGLLVRNGIAYKEKIINSTDSLNGCYDPNMTRKYMLLVRDIDLKKTELLISDLKVK